MWDLKKQNKWTDDNSNNEKEKPSLHVGQGEGLGVGNIMGGWEAAAGLRGSVGGAQSRGRGPSDCGAFGGRRGPTPPMLAVSITCLSDTTGRLYFH